VVLGDDGYFRVDYARFGLKFMRYREWLALPPAERGLQESFAH
jgi:hypothetical protein